MFRQIAVQHGIDLAHPVILKREAFAFYRVLGSHDDFGAGAEIDFRSMEPVMIGKAVGMKLDAEGFELQKKRCGLPIAATAARRPPM